MIAFGSAIHNRSSWIREAIVLVRAQAHETGVVSITGKTYSKGALPTNDVPELL